MLCLNFLHILHVHVEKVSAPMIVRHLEMIPKAAGESTDLAVYILGTEGGETCTPSSLKPPE